MKPVLDGQFLDFLNNNPIEEYEKEKWVWGRRDIADCPEVPWKNTLDNVMCYL
jgi:hypothetical protein